MPYSNNTGISLPIAVWLATDNYGGKSKANPYQISATTLLKSPRQIVLNMRAKPEDEDIDVADIVKSRIGNAIHTAIEQAWNSPSDTLTNTLASLGISDTIAKNIVINPHPDLLTIDTIPVYLEQRAYKSLGKWTVTGEFDFVFNGQLHDFKSTGVYTYVNDTKTGDYIRQGSIYRWLNPTKITTNKIIIDFIFMDWKQSGLAMQSNYPPAQTLAEGYPLLTLADTEEFIKSKLDLIESLELTDEAELPLCTNKELWRNSSSWKYYKSGQVTARSTKNFETASDAYQRMADDGNTGIVLEIKGQPTACLYCNVSNLCTQKDGFIASGDLVI